MRGKGLTLMCVTVLPLLFAGHAVAQSSTTGEAKTLKEKLSDKATDEQRVDNCRVPVDRRGPTARPGCATETLSSSGSPRR